MIEESLGEFAGFIEPAALNLRQAEAPKDWRIYRATELRLSLEHSQFDDEFTESEATALFVHLKRRIWPQ